MALLWNSNQREILSLFQQGKTFEQVIAAGYSNSTVARVLKEFKAGHIPPEEVAQTETPPSSKVKQGGATATATVAVPVKGIAQFEIGQEKIPIFPEDMMQCFDHYRDMRQQLGWQSDFSSTLRESMKLLRAVVISFTPEEVQDDTRTTG
jgi:hypothetical protein